MRTTEYNYNGIQLRIGAGERFDVDAEVVREVQSCYFWDRIDTARVQTAVDVGAHIGSWTLTLLKHQPQAQVACIEPSPETFALLKQNIKGKAALYEQVFAYHGAPYAIALHRFASAANAVILPEMEARYRADPDRTHFIPAPTTITLEMLLVHQGWERVNLLKLDCEGFERHFFRWASDTMLRCVDTLVAEVHYPLAEFEQVDAPRLCQHGFECAIQPHPTNETLFYLFATQINVG